MTDWAAERIKDALATLDALAESGDGAARQAANLLRAQRGAAGRPPEDDSDPLRRVAELVAEGKGKRAVGIVARSVAGPDEKAESIARRLRRKLAKKNGRN